MNWIRFIVYKSRSLELRIRGTLIRAYILMMGGQCGPGLQVGRRFFFKHPPHEGYRIGCGVFFGNDVTIDVERQAELRIDNGVKVTGYCQISASGAIEIGSHSLIGEFTSIRDSNHGTSLTAPIGQQELSIGSVQIGGDVWIGRGVAIIKGAHIGDGAVIAANAVVRTEVPAQQVVAGVPARMVGERTA